MKIAVTGGTGFIGARLLDLVAGGGDEVQALTRRGMKPKRNVEWVQGTLEDKDALDGLVEGCGAVIHIAGVISGRTAADFDPCNVEGTRKLAEAALAAGATRFVHVSSLAAREPSLSLYGASKAKSEDVVRKSGLDWTIVRPPTVYGPGDKETLELFRWAQRGLVMLPPEGRASIIHADDLARLLLRLARGGASGLVLEPQDETGGISHREFGKALGDAVGQSAVTLSMPRPALRLGAAIDTLFRGRKAKLTPDRAAYFCHPDWVADPGRQVPQEIWKPAIPLNEGLAATARWYRSNAWL